MNCGNINLKDGIDAVLGPEGLDLVGETRQVYEAIFWEAMSQKGFCIEEALDEVLTQLCVQEFPAIKLKRAFEVSSSTRWPRIRIQPR